MTKITTHVLDTVSGRPAGGMEMSLSRLVNGEWVKLGGTHTDEEGRCPDLWQAGGTLEAGRYRMRFSTEAYFVNKGRPVFYPFIDIVFDVEAGESHYHIPLLLSSYGYSTYRGS